jgi:hypothetical protein
MEPRNQPHCTAFEGARRVASGDLTTVALAAMPGVENGILIFDDETGEQIEVDFRGSPEEVLSRLKPADESRGRGRPRLGVIPREVTLLPRHWDWLGAQPGGASVALRMLVEAASRSDAAKLRRAQEAAYRFLSAMAGNLPGFEEATRAFFAGDVGRFQELTEGWPADIRDHSRRMAGVAFAARRSTADNSSAPTSPGG